MFGERYIPLPINVFTPGLATEWYGDEAKIPRYDNIIIIILVRWIDDFLRTSCDNSVTGAAVFARQKQLFFHFMFWLIRPKVSVRHFRTNGSTLNCITVVRNKTYRIFFSWSLFFRHRSKYVFASPHLLLPTQICETYGGDAKKTINGFIFFHFFKWFVKYFQNGGLGIITKWHVFQYTTLETTNGFRYDVIFTHWNFI